MPNQTSKTLMPVSILGTILAGATNAHALSGVYMPFSVSTDGSSYVWNDMQYASWYYTASDEYYMSYVSSYWSGQDATEVGHFHAQQATTCCYHWGDYFWHNSNFDYYEIDDWYSDGDYSAASYVAHSGESWAKWAEGRAWFWGDIDNVEWKTNWAGNAAWYIGN